MMLRLGLVTLGLLLAPLAAAQSPLQYPLPGNQALLIEAPANWEPQEDGHQQANTVVLGTDAFRFMLTPGPGRVSTLAEMKATVTTAARRVGPKSVEGELAVQELRGTTFAGFLYIATDPDPEDGQFKIMVQGAGLANQMPMFFTILYNDAGADDAKLALRVLQTLQVVPRL